MALTPKERMLLTIRQQPVDRIPTQINYTARMGKKMADAFGVPVSDLPEFLGNHVLRVDLNHAPTLNDDGSVAFDWWGVGFDTSEEGYFAAVNPLKEDRELDRFSWPDASEASLLEKAQQTIRDDGDSYFIIPNFGFALFERAWSLRGFEQFFMDMAINPAYAHELLDRITDIQITLIRRFLDLGVDGGYFGDDYGAQRNLLFSPQMWRTFIKPRLARLFAPFRERDLPVILHSDGQIQAILPDLVEIGLTMLNPVQPEVLDHGWLRENFGEMLTFYGGISTQTVLPHGSPSDVREAVARCIDVLSPKGTGLLIAPSHRMMADIPLANVSAMLQAFRSLS